MSLLRHLVPVLLLLLSHPVSGQSKDTLYFYNRTQVVGELLNIRLGRIEFDADGIGIINVKNTDVESIYAQSRTFRIETLDRRVYQGSLLRSREPGMVVIHSVVESHEISLEAITGLTWYGKTWKGRITGNVGAGYTFTKSSQIGRLNVDFSVKYNTARASTRLDGSMILTTDSTQLSRDRENVSLTYNYPVANLWIAGAIFRYQRNLELGLQRRFQETIGFGRKVIISKSQQALLLSGVAVNQELNLEGSSTRSTELVFQLNHNLYSFRNPNITFSFVETSYVSMTQKGRFRLDGDISLKWELIKDFSVSLQFYHNYDSKSPANGERSVDLGFVTGLNYEF